MYFPSGFGESCWIISGIVAIQEYFDAHRGKAAAAAMAGSSIGVFMWSPIMRWAIDNYCWQGALLWMGTIKLQGYVFGCILRPMFITRMEHHKTQCNEQEQMTEIITVDPSLSPNRTEEKPNIKSTSEKKKRFEWKNLMSFINIGLCPCRTNTAKNDIKEGNNVIEKATERSTVYSCKFLTFCTGASLMHFGHLVPYAFIPLKAVYMDIDKSIAALILSTMGISSCIFRILFGCVGDKKGVNRLMMYALAGVICGIVNSLSIFGTTYIHLIIYAICFAFLSGKLPHLLI